MCVCAWQASDGTRQQGIGSLNVIDAHIAQTMMFTQVLAISHMNKDRRPGSLHPDSAYSNSVDPASVDDFEGDTGNDAIFKRHVFVLDNGIRKGNVFKSARGIRAEFEAVTAGGQAAVCNPHIFNESRFRSKRVNALQANRIVPGLHGTLSHEHVLTAGQIDAVRVGTVDRIAYCYSLNNDIVTVDSVDGPAWRVFDLHILDPQLAAVHKIEHRAWSA